MASQQQEGFQVIWARELKFKFQELGNDWFVPEDNRAALLKQGTLVSVWGTAKVSKGRYRVCFRVSRTRYAFGWDDTTPLTVGVQFQGQDGKLTANKVSVNVNQLSPFRWGKINVEVNVPDGEEKEISLFLLETTQAKWKAGLEILFVTVAKIAQITIN